MRSKTLTDYLLVRDLPRIQCGIFRKSDEEEQLQEAFDLEQSDHFPFMANRVSDLPSHEGYQYRSHGVWVSPKLDHIMYRSAGETQKFPVHEYQKANVFAMQRSNDFQKEVESATKSLAPEYNMYTKAHISAISAYTKNSAGDINNKLTKKSRLAPADKHSILTLDDAVHAHASPHDMVVWSGINPDHAHQVVIHDKVHHPAYLSTSLSPHIAAAFARFKQDRTGGLEGHMLKIHVPHGYPGAFVGHISHSSLRGGLGEHELILPRDTVLNIHREKTLYAPIPNSDGKSVFTIHHATIEPRK